MASAQHGGLWLLGTVREGALKNTGATTVTQESSFVFPLVPEQTIAQLPAGACIQNIRVVSASTIAAGAGPVPISFTPTGGVQTLIGNLAFVASVANAVAIYNITSVAPTLAQAAAWQNIGPVDGRLSFNTGLAAGVTWYVSVTYTVRNPDGTAIRVR